MTATVPYIVLAIFFGRAISLEGSVDGIKHMFKPEVNVKYCTKSPCKKKKNKQTNKKTLAFERRKLFEKSLDLHSTVPVFPTLTVLGLIVTKKANETLFICR